MNVEIAGDLSRRDLENAVLQIQESFPRVVDGLCNSHPAKYKVEIGMGSSDYLTIYEELVGRMVDFMPEEERKRCERRGYFNTPLVQDIAYVFPHHRLAQVRWWLSKEKYASALNALEKQGYTVIESKCDSLGWGKERKLEILSSLRDPLFPHLSSIDARAMHIVSVLSNGLEEQPEQYTFCTFTPKWVKLTSNEDWYRHSDGSQRIRKVKTQTEMPVPWVEKSLPQFAKNLPLARAVGLSSRVKTEKGVRHIPMIDFDNVCNGSFTNEALKSLGMKGVVVVSGRSYHFYGFELLGEDELLPYLDRIKEYPAVDTKWVDLQKEQGFMMLRLTPSRGKLTQPCFDELYNPPDKRPEEGYSKIELAARAA